MRGEVGNVGIACGRVDECDDYEDGLAGIEYILLSTSGAYVSFLLTRYHQGIESVQDSSRANIRP